MKWVSSERTRGPKEHTKYKYSGILQILLENVLVRYKPEIVIKDIKENLKESLFRKFYDLLK